MKNKIQMFEKDSIEILIAESEHTLPLHSHECFCFGIVFSGEVHFRINDQEKLLKKDDLFIIPSNVGVTINAKERYGYITMCLKNDIKDSLMQFDYKDYFMNVESPDCIYEACDAFVNGGSRDEFLKSILPFLMRVQTEKSLDEKKNDEVVNKAMEYIKSHVYDDFNLDEICEYVHVSKYHFIRIFKKRMGVTPNQYYIQAKLFVAKQMLKQNEEEKNVAAELNFTDQSYLCNVFKKRMGISMKEFKENYQNV